MPPALFEKQPKAPYREDGREVGLPADFYSTAYYTDKLIEYIRERARATVGPSSPMPPTRRRTGRCRCPTPSSTATAAPTTRATTRSARGASRAHAGTASCRPEPTEPRTDAIRTGLERASRPTSGCARPARWKSTPRWSRTSTTTSAACFRLSEDCGRYDDTLVLFFSDNGAEGNQIGRMETNAEWIPKRFDNSLANLGRVSSYAWLGPAWAQAVTPFRLWKSFPTEGGVRVPAIVRWGRAAGAAAWTRSSP